MLRPMGVLLALLALATAVIAAAAEPPRAELPTYGPGGIFSYYLVSGLKGFKNCTSTWSNS